jgi:predicted tellurium resistance membrane protein TerC
MDSDYLVGIFQLFFVLLAIMLSKKDRQHNGQKDKEELKDTKEVIRIHKSKKDTQHNGQKDKEELEDTKEVIRIHKLAIMLSVLL